MSHTSVLEFLTFLNLALLKTKLKIRKLRGFSYSQFTKKDWSVL